MTTRGMMRNGASLEIHAERERKKIGRSVAIHFNCLDESSEAAPTTSRISLVRGAAGRNDVGRRARREFPPSDASTSHSCR